MKTRLAWLLVGIGLAVPVTAAFADELPWWMNERRIIGNNDLEPIEQCRDSVDYEKARIVARVETAEGMGFCTASRVAPDLFLTNFHCFEYKPCNELMFHLGYEKGLKGSEQLRFKCSEVLSKNLNLDYALYRVQFVGNVAAKGKVKTQRFFGLNLAIPDDDAAGVSKTFDIERSGAIHKMELRLEIEHSFSGDLLVTLISPTGTTTTLHNRTGSGDDLKGRYSTSDALKSFVGKESAGAWKLTIKDLNAEDTGTFKSASFFFTTESDEPMSEGASPEAYPTATLWAGPLWVGQPLIVASHPQARLKEIDRSADCKLESIESEVVSERESIAHTCDTEGGSSGSPILDRETGRIVALHWGGQDGSNLSIPMSKIVEKLEDELTPEDFAELNIER